MPVPSLAKPFGLQSAYWGQDGADFWVDSGFDPWEHSELAGMKVKEYEHATQRFIPLDWKVARLDLEAKPCNDRGSSGLGCPEKQEDWGLPLKGCKPLLTEIKVLSNCSP